MISTIVFLPPRVSFSPSLISHLSSLISHLLIPHFSRAAASNNIAIQMKVMRELLNELPKSHFDILEFLLSFLDEMTQFASTSMMSASNLAIVFGPALMHKEEEDIAQLMRDSPVIVRVITEMIRQYGFLFQVLSLPLLFPLPPSLPFLCFHLIFD